jgi:hypothetical protein
MRALGRALSVGASAVGVAAVAVAAVAAVVHPAAADTNTIANPGFESGLSGWSCTGGSAVTGHAHSGSSSLAGTPTGQDNAQCTQTVTVAPNTKYTLSGWVNGSYVYLGVNGTGTTDVSNWTPGSGGYQELTASFTTGAATSSVTIYVHGWYGQPTYYADDFSMPGPGGTPSPTSPTASPTTPPTGSPTASPPTSPSVSPTPPVSSPPPATGGFKAPIYFMPLDNQPQNLTDAMSASGARAFNLAFVLDAGGCTPAWNGDASHAVSSDTTVAGMVTAVRAAFAPSAAITAPAGRPGRCGRAAYQQVINTS